MESPERMRQAVADYVAAVHAAYLRQASLFPPAVQGRLPLLTGDRFWVAAVGARHLHLLATNEALRAASAKEVAVDGEAGPLAWTVRFYDPVVLPAVGLLAEADGPAAEEVRRLLGVTTALYHLTLKPPFELAEHNAGHTGTGLAHGHAAEAREFDALRSAAHGRERLVDEMEGASLAGLVRAQALLAREIAPDDREVARLAASERPDPRELRRAVLQAVRAR
jgi:hypothetical protein